MSLSFRTHSKLTELQYIQRSEGTVWSNFNVWFQYQLKYIAPKFWAKSPLIRAVALVNLDEPYARDRDAISRENLKMIEKISEKYTEVFQGISQTQFENWITRNFILVNAFSDTGIDPLNDSKYLVEIGPGLGAIISLGLESQCQNVYAFDTYEMQSTFSAVTSKFPSDYSRLQYFTVNDLRNSKPFNSPKKETTVLAFWSFTEIKETERLDYFKLFEAANTILIGSNEKFEGIENYLYIEEMARKLNMNYVWKNMGDVFNTELPKYQKKHRIYLLTKS